MRRAIRAVALLTVVAALAIVTFATTREEHEDQATEARPVEPSEPGDPGAHCVHALPATGQDTSYGSGSDGDVRGGRPLRYRDNGDGTITDLNTGLTWEKKADHDNRDVNCTSVATCPDPHDADNRYIWSRGSESFDGPIATVFLEQLRNHCDKDATIACMSDADCTRTGGRCGFAGYRDWRIPNWKELASIVDYEKLSPSISDAFNSGCTGSCTVTQCSCTVPNVHWTSSTHLEDHSWGGYVSFYDGNLFADAKFHSFFARAVRGGATEKQPANGGKDARHDEACVTPLPASGQSTSYGPGSDGDLRAGAALGYRDNGDGTITDLNTALMWEKKDGYFNFYVHCSSAEQCPNPHDADNQYTWGAGNDFDGSLVSVFLEQLNNRCSDDAGLRCARDRDCEQKGGRCGFAGHRDWRIPNAKELQSIVNYENMAPSVSAALNSGCTDTCTVKECSCTAPGTHWTSTTYPADSSWAAFVGFFNGNMYAEAKTTYFYARAVRDGR